MFGIVGFSSFRTSERRAHLSLSLLRHTDGGSTPCGRSPRLVRAYLSHTDTHGASQHLRAWPLHVLHGSEAPFPRMVGRLVLHGSEVPFPRMVGRLVLRGSEVPFPRMVGRLVCYTGPRYGVRVRPLDAVYFLVEHLYAAPLA
jgi:hypothetical protein